MNTQLYFIAEKSLFQFSKNSTDWALDKTEVKDEFHCLAADPFKVGRLYAGTFDNGLMVSEDHGKTWTSVGDGITHPRVLSVAVSGTEVDNGYGTVWAGTEPSELYRSEDGGKTWTTSQALEDLPSRPTWSFPPRPETHHVRSIQPDLHDENRIFVGIELGGVMRSEDKGMNFEDRKDNSQFDCHTLTMNNLAKGRIYEAAGGGYAESVDGGDTWQTINDGLGDYTYLVDIATDRGNPNVIIASAAKGARTAYNFQNAKTVIVRKENDEPWEIISDGLPQPEGATIFALTSHPTDPGVFYAVNNQGVFQSSDTGKTWQSLIKEWPEHLTQARVRSIIALNK